MGASMSVRARTGLRPTPLALAVALVAGCGESDLSEHHRAVLAEASAGEGGASATIQPQAPDLGAANGQGAEPSEPVPVDGGTGAGAAPPPDASGAEGPPEGAGTAGTPGPDEAAEEGDSTEIEPIGEGAAGSGQTTSDGTDDAGPAGPSEGAGGGTADAAEPPDETSAAGTTGGDAGASGEADGGAGTTAAGGGGSGAETGAGTETGGEQEPGGAGAAEGDAAAPAPMPSEPSDASGSDPDLTGTPVEGVDLDDYELVFADEFEGVALDPSRWKTAFEYGNVRVEEELQYYVDTLGADADFGHDPFTVAGGTLTVRAIETPDELRADANGQDWLSGVISTATAGRAEAGGFELQRGDYVEIRADLPRGSGLGSMFTLIASDYATPPRPTVFAMRHDGADADELLHDYQFTDAEGRRRSPGAFAVQDDALAEGFHTVGVSWDEEGLLYFVDGEATYRIVGDSLPAQPLYLTVNLAVGGVSRSAPDAATPRPAELVIDRVRVWRPRP